MTKKSEAGIIRRVTAVVGKSRISEKRQSFALCSVNTAFRLLIFFFCAHPEKGLQMGVMKMAKYTREMILQMAEEEDVEFIRLQFTDMFGTLEKYCSDIQPAGKGIRR